MDLVRTLRCRRMDQPATMTPRLEEADSLATPSPRKGSCDERIPGAQVADGGCNEWQSSSQATPGPGRRLQIGREAGHRSTSLLPAAAGTAECSSAWGPETDGQSQFPTTPTTNTAPALATTPTTAAGGESCIERAGASNGARRFSRRPGNARSRSRERANVLALIEAIQGAAVHMEVASTPRSGGVPRAGSAGRSTAESAKERRAESCRAVLEAARGPVEDGRRSPAASADDRTALPQRSAQPCRSAAVGGPTGELVLSHALLVTGSVTWCRSCGAYADARVRGLRGRCSGPPVGRGGSGRTSLRRLMAGCHPLTGEPLGAKTMSLRAPTWTSATPGGGGLVV